jgi:hypothetical protein
MSAYQVSTKHIATILNTYAVHAAKLPTVDHLLEIAEILAHENAASVNYRYTGTDAAVEVTTADLAAASDVSPVAAVKLIDCLIYQSCEHHGWEASEAFLFCATMRAVLEVGNSEAAYNAARWSI